MKEQILKELEELESVARAIETPIFQEYFIKTHKQALEELKGAYNCDSLKELWRLKGEKKGLDILFDNLRTLHSDIESKRNMLKDYE